MGSMSVVAKRGATGGHRKGAAGAAAPGGVRRLAARMLSRLAESLNAPAQAPAPRAVGRCTLETLLRAYLARGSQAAPARLFLISLQDIREAFGPEWERVGRKVMLLADTIVGETLPPGDSYSHHSDDSLVVMVVERQPGASRAALRRTLDLLRRRLGGGAGGACGVTLKAVTLTEVLRVQHPRAISAAPRSSGQAAVTASAPLSPAQLAERIHRQIAFMHRPVWSARGQEVDAFLCLARRSADYGTFTGKWVLNGGYDDPFAFGVDLRALDTVLGALPKARSLPRAPSLVLPLHFRSLIGDSGDRLLRALAARVEDADRAFLIFEILGPLDSLPLNRLPAIVGALRKLGAAVWVRGVHTRLGELLPHLRGVDAFGIDLNDLARSEPDPDQRARWLADLPRVLEAGRAPKAELYVWDVRSKGEVQAARAAGASLLAGPAVMGDLDAPRGTVGMPERDLGLLG